MKTNNFNSTIREAKREVSSVNINPLSNLQVLNKLARKNEFIDKTNVSEVLSALPYCGGKYHMDQFARNSQGQICEIVSIKNSCRYEIAYIFGKYYRLKPVKTDLNGCFRALCSVAKYRREFINCNFLTAEEASDSALNKITEAKIRAERAALAVIEDFNLGLINEIECAERLSALKKRA